MRFLPVLLMLLAFGAGFPARSACAQDDNSPSENQVLLNTNNVAPPPPVDEYNSVPPGMLMTENDDTPHEATPAAVQSDSDVMTMGEILNAYEKGRYDTVARHLMPIASHNYPQAQELLGIMYSKGQGVTQDYTTAVSWLTKAAEADQPLAEHYLATLTYAGKGTPQDSVTALMWLYLAVVHYPDGPDKARAIQDRANLAARLSRRDRMRAFEMAHDWLKRKDEAALFDEEEAPQ